jgi:4-hydroxy-3-polyprenylbenzoate decarboxylase
MPYEDLREFISDLEKNGELIRVKSKVSPILEITGLYFLKMLKDMKTSRF